MHLWIKAASIVGVGPSGLLWQRAIVTPVIITCNNNRKIFKSGSVCVTPAMTPRVPAFCIFTGKIKHSPDHWVPDDIRSYHIHLRTRPVFRSQLYTHTHLPSLTSTPPTVAMLHRTSKNCWLGRTNLLAATYMVVHTTDMSRGLCLQDYFMVCWYTDRQTDRQTRWKQYLFSLSRMVLK